MANTSSTAPKWAQKTITLPLLNRGCHLITPKIAKELGQDLRDFDCGLAHVFLQHTSASLTINENYDHDVQADTETFLNRIVPEGILLLGGIPWKVSLHQLAFHYDFFLFDVLSDTSADEFEVTCLYLEVYNEVIYDLLERSSGHLELREDPEQGIVVAGLR